jgi:hypothetical protein
MKNKKSFRFFFIIIALILGHAIYRQFDFKNFTFENTGLAIIYSITFVFSVYFLVKDFKNQSKK